MQHTSNTEIHKQMKQHRCCAEGSKPGARSTSSACSCTCTPCPPHLLHFFVGTLSTYPSVHINVCARAHAYVCVCIPACVRARASVSANVCLCVYANARAHTHSHSHIHTHTLAFSSPCFPPRTATRTATRTSRCPHRQGTPSGRARTWTGRSCSPDLRTCGTSACVGECLG